MGPMPLDKIPYPVQLIGGLLIGLAIGFGWTCAAGVYLALRAFWGVYLALRAFWRAIVTDPQFLVTWVDARREPTCAPNPEFPNGIDVEAAVSEEPFCRAELPYPARRCGYYRIKCRRCGQLVMATTAGRPDDPRSITFNCRLPFQKPS